MRAHDAKAISVCLYAVLLRRHKTGALLYVRDFKTIGVHQWALYIDLIAFIYRGEIKFIAIPVLDKLYLLRTVWSLKKAPFRWLDVRHVWVNIN